jgi:MFS family permease
LIPERLAHELYDKLTDEEDARLCEEIGDKACRATPRSFVSILVSSFFTKLGDELASPKTTLAWLCGLLATPPFIIGLLVPLRESGSMLPQLFIGGFIRQIGVRKWVWVAGSLVQAVAVMGLAVVAFVLQGAAAGWAILALITAFSLARGFCSVAAKDVIGKTVPKSRRGQLNGWSAGIAGLLAIATGVVLLMPAAGDMDGPLLGLLFLVAGCLWLVAAAVYSQIPEYRGATAGGRNAAQALKKLSLLRDEPAFRRFIVTRALLMCSALSAPFYVALAQSRLGSPAWLLGAFVIASGLASLVSAPLWGRFSDRSSRVVMIVAATLTAAVGLATFSVERLLPWLVGTAWFLPLAYFALSVAHSGVRVGRKTYVVNLAGGNRRTDYVALGNSIIGLLLLAVGAVGALTPLIGNSGVIGLLALMGLVGALYGRGLPELEDGR